MIDLQLPKALNILKVLDSGDRTTTSCIVRRIIQHQLEFERRNRRKEGRDNRAAEALINTDHTN